MELWLYVDNKSVFDSVTGTEVVCKDASMKLHALYLRQMLDLGMVKCIVWIDTRDMLADGLTKGKVSRHALNNTCNTGHWIRVHIDTSKTWTAQKTTTTQYATQPPPQHTPPFQPVNSEAGAPTQRTRNFQ